jgi:hypothetical protein
MTGPARGARAAASNANSRNRYRQPKLNGPKLVLNLPKDLDIRTWETTNSTGLCPLN